MICSKAVLAHKPATFLTVVEGFCVLILPIWFSAICSDDTLFADWVFAHTEVLFFQSNIMVYRTTSRS